MAGGREEGRYFWLEHGIFRGDGTSSNVDDTGDSAEEVCTFAGDPAANVEASNNIDGRGYDMSRQRLVRVIC
jgi:hypothetical protein